MDKSRGWDARGVSRIYAAGMLALTLTLGLSPVSVHAEEESDALAAAPGLVAQEQDVEQDENAELLVKELEGEAIAAVGSEAEVGDESVSSFDEAAECDDDLHEESLTVEDCACDEGAMASEPTEEVALEPQGRIVYITRTGIKYHLDGCRWLKSKIAIDIDEAIARGYTACKVCKPGGSSQPTPAPTPAPQPEPEPEAPYGRFYDVGKSHWAGWTIERVADLGLMSGYASGGFGPNDPVTRGQAATILWNMAGHPSAGSGARNFPDVDSSAFYYRAVRWASAKGVINGYADGRFGPEDKVTREQLASMLANYARRMAGYKTNGSAADYASMLDASSVASYAQASVGWCFREGILSGSNGMIMPTGSATRAQVAKMVLSLYKILY